MKVYDYLNKNHPALVAFILAAFLAMALAGFAWVEAQENDKVLCRGQRDNSTSLVELLESARERLQATPMEARPSTYAETLDFYEDEIAKRKAPLPCEVELGLVKTPGS